MSGVESVLLVSVIIRALDGLSPIMRMMGLNSIASMGMITAGAATVAAGIIGIGAASVHAAMGFDQAIHKTYALSDMFKQSGYTMQWYQDQLLALAPQIDVPPTKLANALYFVASAGFRGKEAIDILRYSAMAAAASMGDMSKVADMVTSAMNAYAGAGYSVGQVTDTLMTALVEGKMEMHSLATSFGFVAVTAHTAGFSLQEAAAAVAALTRVSGESGARRMQMDLDNLIRRLGDVGGIEKTAKGLHMQFDKTAFASANFIDRLKMLMQMSGFSAQTLQQLRDKAHGNEAEFERLALQMANANTDFRKLAGGAAAFLPAAVLLTQNGAAYNDILSKMTGHGEKTAEAFARMRESTGQQWNMFKTTLESISILLGLHILPYINKILGGLINLGRGIIAFVQSKQGMENLKWTLLGIALVVGGPLVDAIGAAAVASLPFLAVLLAIIAGGALLGVIIRAVVNHFGGWDAIMRKLQPIIAAIQQAFSDAGRELKKAFADPAIQKAWHEFQAQLPQILPILKAIGVVVGIVLVVGFQLLVASLRGIAGALPGVIQYFTGLVMVIGGVARIIRDVVTGNWSDLPAAFKQIGEGMKNELLGAANTVLGGLGGFFSHFGEMLDGAQKRTDQATAAQKRSADAQKLQIIASQIQTTAAYIHNLEVRKQAIQKALAGEHNVYKQHQLAVQLTQVNGQLQQAHIQQAHLQTQAQQTYAALHKTGSIHQSWWQARLLDASTLGTKVSTATKQAFENVRNGIHTKLEEAHQRVVQFGDKVTSAFHTGLEKAKNAVLAPFRDIGQLFVWLYNHNYYFQDLVDAIHAHLLRARALFAAAVVFIRAKFTEFGTFLHSKAVEIWDKFVRPVLDAKKRVETAVHNLVDLVQHKIDEFKALLATRAIQAWDQFIAPILGFKKRAETAVHDNVTQPIQNKWNELVAFLSGAGERVMKMIGDDIKRGAHWVEDAAKAALKGLAGWLGFHSPAPKVPESAQWGSNLARMFATSLIAGSPQAEAAARAMMQRVQAQMGGGGVGVGVNGSGSSATSLALAGMSGAGGGGVTHIHNWDNAFPNATNRDEIVAAIRDVQQQDYRAGRRAGSYGGLRAGIGAN